jgi:uncharacterized protein
MQGKHAVQLMDQSRTFMFMGMERNQVIATLRQHEDELHRQGVAHAGLFGSVARGEARADSDIDILIDLQPDARLSVYDYVALKDYIENLFEGPVDVVNRAGLKPYLRTSVLGNVVYAF